MDSRSKKNHREAEGEIEDEDRNDHKEVRKQVADWKREGWRVDSDYFIIDAPINPKNIWDELQPLLPSKYAPFTSDGSGNQGYLFEANI